LSGAISKEQLKDAVKDCRVLHFAGHVDRQSNGIVVADGVVDGKELVAAFGTKVPALVFANACHASTAAPWATSTLTKALLDGGVRHVLAPLWAVPDRDALAFALRVTEAALAGSPLGEAVRRGRLALVADAKGALSFAGYVLFGDPRAALPFEGAKLQGAGRTRSADIVVPTLPLSSSGSPSSPSAGAGATARPAAGLVVVAAVVAAVVVAVAAVAAVAFAATRPPASVVPAVLPAVSLPVSPPSSSPPAKREGPVRLSVLTFQGEAVPGLAALGEGLTESLVTGLAGQAGIKLVERGQIDVDIKELDFQHSAYVDPTTRAQLGKINGAEVVVLGAFTAAGDDLRLTARYVDVASGEVLFAVKVDGRKNDVFGLQDKLVAAIAESLPKLTARVRP
jgi:TolB-like protein